MTQKTCHGHAVVSEVVVRATATGNLVSPKCRAIGRAIVERVRLATVPETLQEVKDSFQKWFCRRILQENRILAVPDFSRQEAVETANSIHRAEAPILNEL